MSVGSRDAAEETLAQGAPKPFELVLTDLPPGAPFEVETLDAQHGFALKSWEAMGSPEPPSREQVAVLREAFQRRMMRRLDMEREQLELSVRQSAGESSLRAILRLKEIEEEMLRKKSEKS